MKKPSTFFNIIIALCFLLLFVLFCSFESDLAYNVAQKRAILFGRYTEAYSVFLLFWGILTIWFCYRALSKKSLNPFKDWDRLTVFKALAVFLSASLVFICFDAVLRLKKNEHYIFNEDPAYYHRLPNQRYSGSFRDIPKFPFSYPNASFDAEEQSFVFSIDSFGFRNKINVDQYSFVAIGDSFTEGSLVSDDEVWVSLLNSSFSLPLYNCGISGSSPLNYLAFLKNRAVDVNAKTALFVLYEGNDLRASNYRAEKKGKVSILRLPMRYFDSSPIRKLLKKLFIECFAGVSSRRFAGDPNLNNPEHPMYPVAWLPFKPNENAENQFAFDVKSLEEYLTTKEKFVKGKGCQESLKMIKEFKENCEKQNKKMVLIFAPDITRILIEDLCEKVPEQQLHAFLATRKKMKLKQGEVKKKLLELHNVKEKTIEEFCLAEEIEFISLTDMLQQKTREGIQTYYCYDQHWTPEGHKVVAEFLAEKLQKYDN